MYSLTLRVCLDDRIGLVTHIKFYVFLNLYNYIKGIGFNNYFSVSTNSIETSFKSKYVSIIIFSLFYKIVNMYISFNCFQQLPFPLPMFCFQQLSLLSPMFNIQCGCISMCHPFFISLMTAAFGLAYPNMPKSKHARVVHLCFQVSFFFFRCCVNPLWKNLFLIFHIVILAFLFCLYALNIAISSHVFVILLS